VYVGQRRNNYIYNFFDAGASFRASGEQQSIPVVCEFGKKTVYQRNMQISYCDLKERNHNRQ